MSNQDVRIIIIHHKTAVEFEGHVDMTATELAEEDKRVQSDAGVPGRSQGCIDWVTALTLMECCSRCRCSWEQTMEHSGGRQMQRQGRTCTWTGCSHGLDWVELGRNFQGTLWIVLDWIVTILCFRGKTVTPFFN